MTALQQIILDLFYTYQGVPLTHGNVIILVSQKGAPASNDEIMRAYDALAEANYIDRWWVNGVPHARLPKRSKLRTLDAPWQQEEKLCETGNTTPA